MSITFMTPVTVSRYNKMIDRLGYEYEETLSGAGSGNIIIVPDSIFNISVTLEVSSGSGKIQTTTNKLQDVIDDNDVIWIDWASGIVTENTQDAVLPVTALKIVNISGAQRILIRAQ